jgi:hypothetical protein
MTQARLGDIIGICRQSVNEIENRHVYPHYTTIGRFSGSAIWSSGTKKGAAPQLSSATLLGREFLVTSVTKGDIFPGFSISLLHRFQLRAQNFF